MGAGEDNVVNEVIARLQKWLTMARAEAGNAYTEIHNALTASTACTHGAGSAQLQCA